MTGTVDVADVIDSQKVSRYQCLIAFMAWLTLFLDGVGNQSIAYIAPALTHDWDLARGALNTVFSLGILGVVIGALVIGPLVILNEFAPKAGRAAMVTLMGLRRVHRGYRLGGRGILSALRDDLRLRFLQHWLSSTSAFFNIGTQIALAALAVTLYPTGIRSTGVSWAHGVARIGSIISVMFAGTVLALHWSPQTMYYPVSIPMFFGCVWIMLLANVRAKASQGAGEPKGRRAMA